ncbi:hypothetical protein GCG54_00001423 [Colletotrichum gloeosporioides]|uniref:DUF1308 domain-containing protein n=1 Tax=Colletotrichum gloeosporioides TaxID=474922 RepID=A0A8H4C8Z8_COLGL|nr:uncharacterized protein GCG54_00001423 [Colletotrichum gloeosporioides]KAF3799381.1 hypothetical protein GCG54_00001423 [Colletotrichum gloeosporioides]
MGILPSSAPDPALPLLTQCTHILANITTLLSELDALKEALTRRPSPTTTTKPLAWNQAVPGLGPFERLVVSEKKHLERMVGAYDTPDLGGEELEALDRKTRLRLDASNYKFYESVWEVAKRCCDLAGMRRELAVKKTEEGGKGKKGKGVGAVVDLVVRGGTEWVKVVTTTERRLFYEMADAGWDWDEEEQEEMLEVLREDGEGSVEVARVARCMIAAARGSFEGYRRPRCVILMSRIEEGRNAHVDRLLSLVRRLGEGTGVELVVETANAGILARPTPGLEEAIRNLVKADPFAGFTDTLNVDCSVFMALASDCSHLRIGPESPLLRGAQHRLDAADEVENGPRLVTTMYPALGARRLVTTREAADTFLRILGEIGTETEKARTRILFEPLGNDECRGERVRKLQTLSEHPVPEDLQLPVEVVPGVSWEEARGLVEEGALPRVALAVGRKGSGLDAMGVSSFLYGWREGITTVTGNWEAVKRLRAAIEAGFAEAGGEQVDGVGDGPRVWRIPFSRKLLAKPRPRDVDAREEDGGGRKLKTRVEKKVEKERSLESWIGEVRLEE